MVVVGVLAVAFRINIREYLGVKYVMSKILLRDVFKGI